MDTNERVKYIRKEKNMTMEEFGSHLGVTKVAISMIESGKRGLTDQNFLAIVREFNVNPEWLRDGEGDPFKKVTRNERIEGFVRDILQNEPTGRKARLIDALASLDADGWDTLYTIACHFAEKQNSPSDETANEGSLLDVVKNNSSIVNAAHERTDIPYDDELQNQDNAIMDDDNF